MLLRKSLRKTIALLITFAMVFTSFPPVSVFAEYYDGYAYVNEGTEIDYPSYDEPEYNEIDNDNAEVDSTPEDDNDLEVGNDSVNDNDLEVDNDSMNDNDLEVGNDSVNDNDLEIDNNSVNDNDLEVGNDSVNDNDLEVDNDSMNDNDLEVDNDSVNDNDLEVDNDSVNDNDLEVGNDSVNDNDLEVDNDSVNDNDFGFATELTIEVAETYVAGEAFELIVRANAAGFLNVYLNDENIYGNFINAFQPIIVQVEEMPPVEAVFDIVLQLDPYGFVYVRETLVLAAYVEYIAIEAELAIEAAESYVAGESFEFEVVPNTAGVLRVYLDNENLFSSAVFADQSVIVQVEEMPPVMASFDVVLVMDSYGLDYVEEDFVVVADIMPFAGWADIDWDLTAPIGGVGDFDFLGTGAGNFTTADLNETGDLTWELNGTWRNGSGTGAINDIQPGGAGRTITATGVPAGPIAVRVWASHAGNNGAIIAIPPTFGVAGNNMTIGGQSADYIVNEVNDVSRPNAGSYVWFYWLDSPGGTLTFNITWPAVEIVPGRVRIAAIDVFEGDGDGSNNGGGTPPTIAVPTQTTGRTGTRINYGTNASVVGQANNPARAAVLFGNSEALLDGGYYRNVEFIAYKYTQFTGTQNQIFQSFAIELSSGADDNRDVVAVRTRTENLAVGTGNYRNYSHLQFGIVNRVQATSNTGGDLPAPNFPTTPPNPFHNPSYSVATANQYRMVVDIDEDTWELTAVISINGNVVSTLQEDVPMGAYVTTIYARSRIGATMHIPAWALYGTSSDFIEAPLVGIEGIVGNTHNFGSVAHNYTASDFSALEITVDNTGTAPAENLEITLTGDVDSFDLSGTLSVASLAVGQEIEFEVVPLEGLASGSHSGVVTIDADGITPISFNVIFDVAFQEANVDWATDATYAFDFGNFPTYMLNHTDNAPDNDQRPLFPVLRGAAISTMSNSTRYISSSASQQNFNLIVGAPGANNFFRPGGNPGSTFIEPNGGGRYLESNVPLTGPIRVELDVVSLITNGSFTLTASFGDQTVSQTVSGTGVQTVVIEFATLEEGILTIGPLPWGVNTPPEVAVNPPGRFGIQAINIYEGEFSGPWLEIPVGLEVNFPSLPHDYTVADLVTELVTITNIGVGTVDMIANVGSNFEIFQAPSTGLGTGAITEVGIRPAIGLAPGLYQDTLVITTDNANTLNIPVSVRVYNPPLLPDTNLFYTGLGTSLPNQFPHNLTEIVNWGHDFRRVVFTEGSHLIRFNGQLRDADVSLAIPFLLNGVLWVPVEAA
ncbi:MAG: MSCRAMM family adhesin SdrC, partial [Defluviitaleaceae bacterium]|nr:MSCRAMM family adhesin SdrC [Defluviitaleaceae bacterium]